MVEPTKRSSQSIKLSASVSKSIWLAIQKTQVWLSFKIFPSPFTTRQKSPSNPLLFSSTIVLLCAPHQKHSSLSLLPLCAWIGPPFMAISNFNWAPEGMAYSSRQNSSCSSTPPYTSCCWYTGIPVTETSQLVIAHHNSLVPRPVWTLIIRTGLNWAWERGYTPQYLPVLLSWQIFSNFRLVREKRFSLHQRTLQYEISGSGVFGADYIVLELSYIPVCVHLLLCNYALWCDVKSPLISRLWQEVLASGLPFHAEFQWNIFRQATDQYPGTIQWR